MTETKFDQSSAVEHALKRIRELREHAKEVFAGIMWMRRQTEDTIKEADDDG
jgi:hypothetical protein